LVEGSRGEGGLFAVRAESILTCVICKLPGPGVRVDLILQFLLLKTNAIYFYYSAADSNYRKTDSSYNGYSQPCRQYFL
jgi:hypothetical protein